MSISLITLSWGSRVVVAPDTSVSKKQDFCDVRTKRIVHNKQYRPTLWRWVCSHEREKRC